MATIDLGKIITTVDSALSATSENPVQNKVVYEALQSVGGSSGLLPPMTQTEYFALSPKEQTLYFIVDNDNVIQRIYYGNYLIAKRGDNATNTGFPLVFPIIFS